MVEPTPTTATSAPAAAPVASSAPAVTAPISAPAQASSEAPVAVAPAVTEPSAPAAPPVTLLSPETPSAEPAPEVKPAEAPVEPKPAEDPKPAEPEKPAEAPKEEGSKSDTPAPLPTYEPWTLPEGVKLDDTQSTEFNSLLGELQNTTKADQALVQKFGQTLVDRHTAHVAETVTRLHEAYQNAWVAQTEGWKEKFINDSEIGGKRQETTLKAANEFITTHGGTAEQQSEFRSLMGTTGIGNHPAMIRMLSNAMSKFSESKQPAPMHFPAEKMSRTQRMYGKKTT